MSNEDIVTQLNRANTYIKKQKVVEAERIIDKLLKIVEPVEIGKYGKILDFGTKLEYFLYCHINGKTNISWTRNYLSDMYLLKGIILFEKRDFKMALGYFEKSLKWNPVSFRAYNEILEACINLRDYTRFDMYFSRAIRLATRPYDLAILYRKLGFVWNERGYDEVAYNLFLYSKLFYPRKEADDEIEYLEKRIGTKFQRHPDLGTIEYLRDKGLLYQRPGYILPTYYALIKAMQDIMKKGEYQTRFNYLTLLDYYETLYFHKPGRQIHSMLLSLQREYAIKFPVYSKNKKEEN